MDMPSDEQNKFEHITRLMSVSPDAVFGQGRLGSAVIDEVNSFLLLTKCNSRVQSRLCILTSNLVAILCFDRRSIRWNA